MTTVRKLEPKKSYIKLLQKKADENGSPLPCYSNQKQRSRSGASNSKQKKAKDTTMKDLLKESYIFVREENDSLQHKLRRKTKKIEQLKEVIKEYSEKIKDYEERLTGKSGQQPTKDSQDLLRSSRRKYEDIIRESQQIAKKSIEKYRKLERQMEEQRLFYEGEISKLTQTNQQLSKQLTIPKETRSIESTDRKRIKTSYKSQKKDLLEIDMWGELKQLREKQIAWVRKEEELKQMLSEITKKINSFEINCRNTEEKAKRYRLEADELRDKYAVKCRKHKQCQEKWKQVFMELAKQTEQLSKQIENTKQIYYLILRKETAHIDKQ